MEAHGSLRMLLDTLLEKETLNSWNIYEEKSGAVVVRVRFSPRHSVSNVSSTDANNGLNIGYKRKSPAQLARDRERARTFNERRMTRSQARGNDDAGVPDVEKERCDTESLFSDTSLSGSVSPVMPATKSRLDPLVLPFSPSAPLPIEEQLSGKPASPTLECVASVAYSRLLVAGVPLPRPATAVTAASPGTGCRCTITRWIWDTRHRWASGA